MAQTSILSSIQRSSTFPITQNVSAPNNCGTLALILNQNWTEQMIHELPTINVAVYVDTDIKLLSIDIDMTTVCSDKTDLEPIKPYSIPLFDLPESFDFVVTPIFDNNALASHNAQIDSGDVNVFNTSDTGIVDTNITDYSSEYWTTRTDSFDIDIVFDDTKITSGGGSGGGGGQTITVDTQVIQGSTNPVQNGAIYDFVNSSVSTSTAYFIGTFNSVEELEAYSGTVTNNDYAFVISTDSDGNTVYNRYKYNGETETWNFEYALNNSSFTAAEWETIQSGLTAQDKTTYSNHVASVLNPHNVTKSQVGLGNVDNTSDANKPISTATQTALNAKQDTVTFDGTYNASTNKAATVSTVTNAINDLDVASVGGSGKYISAISETNGKISATAETMDTVPTNGSTKAVTSGGVYTPLAEDRAALVELVDGGAKNHIILTQSALPSGFVKNSDGSITVNYVNNTSDYFTVVIASENICALSDGSYILSGCPKTSDAGVKYRMDVTRIGAAAVFDVGDGAAFSKGGSAEPNLYRIVVYPNSTLQDVTFRPMICTAADWAVSQKFVPYRLSYQQISDAVLNKTPVVYGFHVNPNESDPSAAVTYLLDAVWMTPAKMGTSTFSYGSWENVFFMPKPCMLKSDGTVDYYLNPNDYTQKSDGTASDVANASYDGNAMMEWPKIWFKYVPGGTNGEWEFYVSNQNVDGTYKCWCNINAAGQEIDHFYTAIYNGTGTTKLRSISGVQLTTANGADNTTRQQEIDRALANNTGTDVMWYTEVWSDRLLINALLYLIGKSLDLQRTFGHGMTSGEQTAKQNYYTGGKLDSDSTFNLDNKGLFWGDITNTTNPVKVFGMENLWGCAYRSCAGLVAVDNALKVKLTYDVQDGSTAHGYNLTGNGYLSFGTSASSGYVTKMKADTDKGYITSSAGGTGASASTYYCDYYYVTSSGTRYALLGGSSGSGADCGFFVCLYYAVSLALWSVSAALSCKPKS